MKNQNILSEVIRWGTIAVNTIFILWASYNAIDENFRSIVYEKLFCTRLIGLYW